MFEVGDKIVYPMHGAGVIENIEEKEILGEKRSYFIMRMPIGEMKVMVPVDNVEEVGVREVVDEAGIEEVMEVLKRDKSEMSNNWNRRFRANMDRIKSGDIHEIAGVVKNLMLRDVEKPLSTGERKMLNDAKQMLVSEMVLVLDLTVEEVEDLLIETVNAKEESEKSE